MRISIFDNQYSAIQELPEDRQGDFWRALMAYVFEDVEPSFSDQLERIMWSLMLPVIDQAKEASRNGAKGGRPSGKQGENKGKTTHKNPPLKPPFKTPHKNQIEIEKEDESEKEGLGVSLKDTLTLPCADEAGGGKPASPAQELAAHVAEMQANAVPCPDHVRAAARQAFQVVRA